MCAPRSKGGKRCLKHAALSKFSVRSTKSKTGADEATIEQTLSQLNKEGKKLPEANPEEVQSWVETKRFATQYDPELTDHERKIQLNQLNRSTQEVEKGVPGGHFYAWKNLTRTVRKNAGRKIAAVTVAGVMSVSLAGCLQNTPFGNGDTPSPNSDYAVSDMAVTDNKVTDSLGEYSTVDVHPDSTIAQYESNIVFGDRTFTDEEYAGAQKAAAEFTMHQFLDSKALDTGPESYQDWATNVAPNYYSPELANDPTLKDGTANPILTNATKPQMPELIRDGGPRESSVILNLNSLSTSTYDGKSYVDVSINYEVDYRVSDKSAVAFSAKVANGTEEDFLNSGVAKDSLKDGKGENKYTSTGWVRLAMQNNNGKWEIAGFQSDSQFSTADFTNQQ
jgi:hypothetical protein